jgi:orotate phosphoribosyltransferase
MAREIATILLNIEAVHYYKESPFRFTSGTLSPVYVDCRKLISFPESRNVVLTAMVKLVRDMPGGVPEVVAGGETAGIPYASFLADRLQLPMVYIRKKPKEFGRQARIEGVLPRNRRVLLVEDLIFDAQSKLSFAEAIREEGGIVDTTLVVFEYGRSGAREQLANAGLSLLSLTTWAELLDLAVERRTFTETQAQVIRRFLADPKGWME